MERDWGGHLLAGGVAPGVKKVKLKSPPPPLPFPEREAKKVNRRLK